MAEEKAKRKNEMFGQISLTFLTKSTKKTKAKVKVQVKTKPKAKAKANGILKITLKFFLI